MNGAEWINLKLNLIDNFIQLSKFLDENDNKQTNIGYHKKFKYHMGINKDCHKLVYWSIVLIICFSFFFFNFLKKF